MKCEEERRIVEHLIACTQCHALIDEELDFIDQFRGVPAFLGESVQSREDSSFPQLLLNLIQSLN
jgi:hypothetical protein